MNIDWTSFNSVKNPCNVYSVKDTTAILLSELKEILKSSQTPNEQVNRIESLISYKEKQQFSVPGGVHLFYKHTTTGRHLTVAYSYDKVTGNVAYNFVMYRPDITTVPCGNYSNPFGHEPKANKEFASVDNWDKERHRFSSLKRLHKTPILASFEKGMKHSEVRKLIRKIIGLHGRNITVADE